MEDESKWPICRWFPKLPVKYQSVIHRHCMHKRNSLGLPKKKVFCWELQSTTTISLPFQVSKGKNHGIPDVSGGKCHWYGEQDLLSRLGPGLHELPTANDFPKDGLGASCLASIDVLLLWGQWLTALTGFHAYIQWTINIITLPSGAPKRKR